MSSFVFTQRIFLGSSRLPFDFVSRRSQEIISACRIPNSAVVKHCENFVIGDRKKFSLDNKPRLMVLLPRHTSLSATMMLPTDRRTSGYWGCSLLRAWHLKATRKESKMNEKPVPVIWQSGDEIGPCAMLFMSGSR